jgi:hypothetical protein
MHAGKMHAGKVQASTRTPISGRPFSWLEMQGRCNEQVGKRHIQAIGLAGLVALHGKHKASHHVSDEKEGSQ